MSRIIFQKMSRPKTAAKRISMATGCSLSAAQRAVARSSGYRDWHDLETSLSGGTPDFDVTTTPSPEDQTHMSELLARELNLTSGDALYALGFSRLFGPQDTNIREQLEIQTRLFRLRELPLAERRQRGAIGKLKSPGRDGEMVILKSFGKPTLIVTHQSGRAAAADFEYVTPRNAEELFIPMRLYLAYGIWTEADDSQVLFSRDYCPMWRLRQGLSPERMNPWERITFTKQEWFWEGRLPWRDRAMHEAEIDRLRKFGVRFLPKLVDTLPLVVSRDDLDFREAVRELGHLYSQLPAA
ncbi:hypothetical protein [Methylocystis suflitae]|uniref:hypothetical protein n=1 Tax=Methylocystis suflitae TaxID=2951405 RepID=UPI0021091EE9|nr:hypothetical protein [Methylocystis suflitae]MCQ4188863.1 hypothetical protein [Methylocystis suflitae]